MEIIALVLGLLFSTVDTNAPTSANGTQSEAQYSQQNGEQPCGFIICEDTHP